MRSCRALSASSRRLLAARDSSASCSMRAAGIALSVVRRAGGGANGPAAGFLGRKLSEPGGWCALQLAHAVRVAMLALVDLAPCGNGGA